MRYLCLVYVDPALAGAASEAEWRQINEQCLAYNDELERSGYYITSNALAEPASAATIRRREGNISMTDGPFAETKEYLGGFFLVEARDLNEAIEIGCKSPMARMGAIEVRATAGF
jgi:hypothetical protein